MEMLPRELVAPEVTFSTIEVRSSAEYPDTVISPRAAVAPLVMSLIASPREDTLKPSISSRESTAPAVILSSAPPNSVAETPLEPKEPTTVSTSSLEALPISVEFKPASSRFATDVDVIFLRTVSVAVDPDSAEVLGSLSLLPLMDFTRLLLITLITLIVSDEFERPTVASFPCEPSMILGIICIRSSELSRLAVVTAAVAASTTKVICELVRELESVLLVLRDETLACLELLVEDKLALSSPITVEAREAAVEPVSGGVEEPSPLLSLLPPQPTNNKNERRNTNLDRAIANDIFIVVLFEICYFRNVFQ